MAGPDKYLGNPHSLHKYGIKSLEMIKATEEKLLTIVNGKHGKIYWTGSGSEANRLAIETFARQGGLVTTDIEHKSIWALRRRYGYACPVNKEGRLEMEVLDKATSSYTSLVSVMMVNNEVGTIQPITETVGLSRKKAPEAIVHSDMAQALGKIPIDLKALDLDLASFSAHKVGGPKGLGCLWVSNRVSREMPYLGTPDPRSIDYFGTALDEFPIDGGTHLGILSLEQTLLTHIKEEHYLNIERTVNRMHGILSIFVPGVDAIDLCLALSDKDVFVSTTSACNNLKQQRSHVLEAIGLPPDRIDSTIRVSLNHMLRDNQMIRVGEIITETIRELKSNGSQSSKD